MAARCACYPGQAGLGVAQMAEEDHVARQGARWPGHAGASYRVAIKPMVPGGKADDSNFRILEAMPVRGIITNPTNGTKLAGRHTRSEVARRGVGRRTRVARVDVSIDFGASWQKASWRAKNRYDWQRWTATIGLPSDGYYEIWVRATDTGGAPSRTWPATGTRRATAPTRCTASPFFG